MSRHASAIRLTGSLLLAVFALGVMAGGVAAQSVTTQIEVAETGSRFSPDPDMVDADGWPLRGNYFVTEGYIYPAGTLTCADGACDGVLYDDAGVAAPEFPDAVVGTWTCYGTHLEDAAMMAEMTGPIAATTQIFDFGENGADSIVTNGYETDDLDVAYQRAVIGGTGMYSGATGVQQQTTIGYNNADLVIDDIPLVGFAFSVELPG